MNKRNWLLLSLFLVFLFVWRLKTLPMPHFVPGTKVKIIGILKEEPKIIGQSQTFSLAGLKIRTWRYPEFHYSDRLEVVGVVGAKGLENPEIKLVEANNNSGLRAKIYDLQRKLAAVYRQTLPEPQAGLLAGIVLGSKSGLPNDFYQNLVKTGTVHMIVASGTNVTIVGSTLTTLFILFFKRRLALILAFLGIWFYVLLAGADAPVVRAGLMGSLAFLAQGLGREADAWRGLGLAAVVLLLINPLNLFDVGFQLSFAATAGILFFGPKFSRLFSRLPNQAQTDLSQTLGAQFATLPIILINFGSFSPLSPVTNMLLVTIVPLLMKLGAVVAMVGLVFLSLAQALAWLLWPFLTYFVKVVEVFARV